MVGWVGWGGREESEIFITPMYRHFYTELYGKSSYWVTFYRVL